MLFLHNKVLFMYYVSHVPLSDWDNTGHPHPHLQTPINSSLSDNNKPPHTSSMQWQTSVAFRSGLGELCAAPIAGSLPRERTHTWLVVTRRSQSLWLKSAYDMRGLCCWSAWYHRNTTRVNLFVGKGTKQLLQPGVPTLTLWRARLWLYTYAWPLALAMINFSPKSMCAVCITTGYNDH